MANDSVVADTKATLTQLYAYFGEDYDEQEPFRILEVLASFMNGSCSLYCSPK